MLNKTGISLLCSLLGASMLFAEAASAGQDDWVWRYANSSGNFGTNTWKYGARESYWGAIKNSGPTVTVDAWSSTGDVNNGPDVLEEAQEMAYSSGLGVRHVDTAEVGQGSPRHAFDGFSDDDTYENMDAMLFEFEEDITLDSVSIGYTRNGNPAAFSLLAFTADPSVDPFSTGDDLSGKSYAGLLTSGWELVGHYYTTGNYQTLAVNDGTATGGTAVSSSYYLLSVLNPELNDCSAGSTALTCASGANHWQNMFKVKAMGGHNSPPDHQVPIPATAFLFVLGLPLLRVWRKRS